MITTPTAPANHDDDPAPLWVREFSVQPADGGPNTIYREDDEAAVGAK